jgi:hypothetical protein
VNSGAAAESVTDIVIFDSVSHLDLSLMQAVILDCFLTS